MHYCATLYKGLAASRLWNQSPWTPGEGGIMRDGAGSTARSGCQNHIFSPSSTSITAAPAPPNPLKGQIPSTRHPNT
jgi:hypothetical protein